MTIRRAGPPDGDAIARIEAAAFDPARYVLFSRRRLAANLANPACRVFVWDDPDMGVIGYSLGFSRRGQGWLRFYSLAVDPRAKGRGIGDALFHHFEADAARAGFASVILEIRADNRFLKDRYEALGYRTYRVVDGYYPDGDACLKMRKTIAAATA